MKINTASLSMFQAAEKCIPAKFIDATSKIGWRELMANDELIERTLKASDQLCAMKSWVGTKRNNNAKRKLKTEISELAPQLARLCQSKQETIDKLVEALKNAQKKLIDSSHAYDEGCYIINQALQDIK